LSLYEGMFLMDNRQANRDWDGSLDAMKAIIAKHGGSIVRCEKWGERKLAYEIKGRRRGTYVLVYFEAEGEAVNGIYHDCELSELILRVFVLAVKVVPPEGTTHGDNAAPAPKAPVADKAAAPAAPAAAAEAAPAAAEAPAEETPVAEETPEPEGSEEDTQPVEPVGEDAPADDEADAPESEEEKPADA
jgi:small subunit ribosomal protein S6